jgi:DNA-nicking Smr family endonuclease
LNCSIRRSQLDTALPPGDNGLGGKAGKIAYPIAVGEVTNLYKTSKKLAKAPITIDLHGHTRDEALQKLDENVGEWVDTAMRGEYPFVIPVDIICGGGSQILSEVVSNWIRTKRQVANRPKGFV